MTQAEQAAIWAWWEGRFDTPRCLMTDEQRACVELQIEAEELADTAALTLADKFPALSTRARLSMLIVAVCKRVKEAEKDG